jgi:hypothetical protein
MSTFLTKEQILGADRRKFEDVNVKEWGGKVRLQEISASERDLWESEQITVANDGSSAKFNPKHARARLIVRSLVDETGKRLFTDDEVAAVGSLSASTIARLFNKARALNAISSDDMKELEGNSDADPSDGASSTSANVSA